MEIRRLSMIEGARQAEGLAVAIDVLRASSHIVTLFARGAVEVLPVETVPEARELKRRHPEWILAGEREGLPPEGFELGNSPFEAEQRDFSGRTVILTTSAGSKGLVAAGRGAEEVVVGCFLNAPALVAFIRRRRPKIVSLLALGVGGTAPAPEDEGAAAYIEGLLQGESPDLPAIFEGVRSHPEGRKFLDPACPHYRPEDLEACLRCGIYDLVPVMREGRLRVEEGKRG